jgi:hypothetical protein
MTILIDLSSEICEQINSFNTGTQIPNIFRSNAILSLRREELLVVTDRHAADTGRPCIPASQANRTSLLTARTLTDLQFVQLLLQPLRTRDAEWQAD